MNEIGALRERAKELNCLYEVSQLTSQRSLAPGAVFNSVVRVLSAGWQRPESTVGCISYLGRCYPGPGYKSGHPSIEESLRLGGTAVGTISISDSSLQAGEERHGFLEEERQLLANIASRLCEYLEWKHLELLGEKVSADSDIHWRWRQRFVEAIVKHLRNGEFGESRVFLGGSTESGQARHGSDIDLYILHRGSQEQQACLHSWLQGWSLSLAEVVQQQTGENFPEGLLNVRWLDQLPDLVRFPTLREV